MPERGLQPHNSFAARVVTVEPRPGGEARRDLDLVETRSTGSVALLTLRPAQEAQGGETA